MWEAGNRNVFTCDLGTGMFNRLFKQRSIRIYLLSVYAYRKGFRKKEERFYALHEKAIITRAPLATYWPEENRSMPEVREANGQVQMV